jgi:hypothetical protein
MIVIIGSKPFSFRRAEDTHNRDDCDVAYNENEQAEKEIEQKN